MGAELGQLRQGQVAFDLEKLQGCKARKGRQELRHERVLVEAQFLVLPGMLYEPDVLEALHGVAVPLLGGCGRLLEVHGHFKGEELVWSHYEAVNSNFFVHRDDDRDAI